MRPATTTRITGVDPRTGRRFLIRWYPRQASHVEIENALYGASLIGLKRVQVTVGPLPMPPEGRP